MLNAPVGRGERERKRKKGRKEGRKEGREEQRKEGRQKQTTNYEVKSTPIFEFQPKKDQDGRFLKLP
jgi:predicted transposase YdaD